MSFGFGTTPAFGTVAAKPTGFGAPIMSTTSAAPTFGLGAPATAAAPTAFGGFGTTPASTGLFGGFGSFGTTAPTATATAAAPAFGGFGSFGAPAASTATSGFSFGGQTSTAPATGFSFGAPAATTAPTAFGGFGAFGSTAPAPTTSLFGGLGQTSTTGGFGGFGTKPATNFGNLGGAFGAPSQTVAQPQPIDPNVAFYDSIYNCQIFGDERDNILRRWNLLQALYGFGKGFYSHQAPPIDYDMKNPFCRFKGIAYSVRPTSENKDGCVAVVFNKKESEMRALESQIITNFGSILGNKPNILCIVESIRALSDSKTIVVISVQEKAPNGNTRNIPAQELTAYLLQPMPKQQLTGLQVENVFPQVELSSEQLREYLDAPPPGVDPQLWQQAQEDNPNPDRLIPVPVVGFGEVRWRMKCQETEAGLQQSFLDRMAEEMADLQRKHTATVANIVEFKSRLVELQHRILKVVILQEKSRKMGMSLLPEEEELNSRLEKLSSSLNSTAFKNRLSALTEGVKSLSDSNKEPQRYRMDPSVVADIKQFLNMEQAGMSHMISTIQSDLSELKIIKDGMVRLVQRPV